MRSYIMVPDMMNDGRQSSAARTRACSCSFQSGRGGKMWIYKEGPEGVLPADSAKFRHVICSDDVQKLKLLQISKTRIDRPHIREACTFSLTPNHISQKGRNYSRKFVNDFRQTLYDVDTAGTAATEGQRRGEGSIRCFSISYFTSKVAPLT